MFFVIVRSNIRGNRHEAHLAQSDDALLRAHATTLDHDEVVVHFAIVRETAHRSNGLLSEIVLGRGVVLDDLHETNKNNVSKFGVIAFFMFRVPPLSSTVFGNIITLLVSMVQTAT